MKRIKTIPKKKSRKISLFWWEMKSIHQRLMLLKKCVCLQQTHFLGRLSNWDIITCSRIRKTLTLLDSWVSLNTSFNKTWTFNIIGQCGNISNCHDIIFIYRRLRLLICKSNAQYVDILSLWYPAHSQYNTVSWGLFINKCCSMEIN